MKKIMISDEEIICHLHREWEDRKEAGEPEMWLSTRAFQKLVEAKGLRISYPTASSRLKKFAKKGLIRQIKTSFGTCWMSIGDDFIL